MEFEHQMSPNVKNMNPTNSQTTFPTLNSPSHDSLSSSNHSESFRTLQVGVPNAKSSNKKLSWLRNQIVGYHAEFDSPFGKRRITYADHTASGRSLHYIENFVINNVLPFYGNSHTTDSYVGGHTTKMVHEAAAYVKKCLGGGEEDAIIFCGSGSTAAIKRLQEVMCIAVASPMREKLMKCMSNQERWVVFVGPYEHHSNLLSWRQSLAQVIEIGLDNDGLIDMNQLSQQLEFYKHANRPILGSFSACSNVTGIYSDTRAIASLLHQYGAFACFDFAASGAYVEIDMRSGEIDGYDAVFISPHKFAGGPGTPGILLMNKALYQLRSSPPSTCGGGTVHYVNGFTENDTLYVDEIEERENGGTPPIIQTIRAALAFWVKEYIGYEVIQTLETMYINKAMERLQQNKNIRVLGNTSVKRQAILSFLIFSTTNTALAPPGRSNNNIDMWAETGNKRDKTLHQAFVASLLNDLFGIQARAGCACAGPYGHHLLNITEPRAFQLKTAIQKGYNGIKPGWTRISFSYYMSNEEFEFILAAVEFIAIYGQRFLPLYRFNLRTGSWTVNDTMAKHYIFNNKEDSKCCDCGIVNKFASYLESAKHFANLLPKFPASASHFTQKVDPSLIHFRV